MTDVLEEINSLRIQVQQLQEQKARRAAQMDAAKANLLADLKTLKDEFGCESVEAARSLLADLESELREDIERLRQALEEA